jgi:3-oxoacyl-[acyl-carrier-protein] synthase II
MRRVVVTGIGLVTPLGGDVETSWSNIKAAKSGAGTITRFDASD